MWEHARGAREDRGRRVFSELPPAPGVCSRVILRRCTAVALHLLAVGPVAQAQSDSTRAADRLGGFSEAQLDSLYGPLVYLMQPDERGVYPALSLAGKRDYLRRFWAQRDPTPGTAKNEAEETFNARIAVVNRKFRESGTSHVPGWRTDRGRIYLEYGPPDVTLGRRGPGVAVPFDLEVHPGQDDAQILFRGSHRLRQLRARVLERPGRAEPP